MFHVFYQGGVSVFFSLGLLRQNIGRGIRIIFRLIVGVFRRGVVSVDTRVTSQYVRGLRLVLRARFFWVYTYNKMRFNSLSAIERVSNVRVFRRFGYFLSTSVFVWDATRVVNGIMFAVQGNSNSTGSIRSYANLTTSATLCLFSVGQAVSLFREASYVGRYGLWVFVLLRRLVNEGGSPQSYSGGGCVVRSAPPPTFCFFSQLSLQCYGKIVSGRFLGMQLGYSALKCPAASTVFSAIVLPFFDEILTHFVQV